MTKMHYEAMAKSIKQHMCSDTTPAGQVQRDTAASIARDFAYLAIVTGKHFDKVQFFTACGLDSAGRVPA